MTTDVKNLDAWVLFTLKWMWILLLCTVCFFSELALSALLPEYAVCLAAFLEWSLNGTVASAVHIQFTFQLCRVCVSPHALTLITVFSWPVEIHIPLPHSLLYWVEVQTALVASLHPHNNILYILSDMHVYTPSASQADSLLQGSIDCLKDALTCHCYRST